MASKSVQDLSADAWAAGQRFYAPMPFGAESPVTVPEAVRPRLLVPDMPDWAWQYACDEINRRRDGVPPLCASCGIVILCYPFHAVECHEWIKCDHCYYTEMHASHNGRCGNRYCPPGC